MFAYIRRKVAAAVLGGFADALETLEASHASQQEPLPLPEPLRLRLAEAGQEDAEPDSTVKPKRSRT